MSLADAKVASVTLSDLGDIFASTALLGAHPVVPLPLIGFGETLAKHGGASSQLMTPHHTTVKRRAAAARLNWQ